MSRTFVKRGKIIRICELVLFDKIFKGRYRTILQIH